MVAYALSPYSFTIVTTDNTPPDLKMIKPTSGGYYPNADFVLKFEMLDASYDPTVHMPGDFIISVMVDGTERSLDTVFDTFDSDFSGGIDPALSLQGWRMYTVPLLLDSGAHSCTVTIKDNANLTTTQSVNFQTWAGTISGIAKIDGVEVYDGMIISGTVEVSLQVTEGLEGLTECWLRVDGQYYGTDYQGDWAPSDMEFDGVDTYTSFLDTSTLIDGTHTVEIEVRDINNKAYMFTVFSGDFDTGNYSPVAPGLDQYILIGGIALIVLTVIIVAVVSVVRRRTYGGM